MNTPGELRKTRDQCMVHITPYQPKMIWLEPNTILIVIAKPAKSFLTYVITPTQVGYITSERIVNV